MEREIWVNLAGEGIRRALSVQVQGCSGRCWPPGIRLFVRHGSRVVWWPRRRWQS